jgi:limonene-1,2-epoxide hydrolase
MKDDELRTIFTTTYPAQAEMVRVALESEGIPAFVDGANQGGFTGALDVHVSVAQKDADRAAVLVEELDRVDVSHEEWEEALGEEAMDEDAT